MSGDRAESVKDAPAGMSESVEWRMMMSNALLLRLSRRRALAMMVAYESCERARECGVPRRRERQGRAGSSKQRHR